jgi:DNA helicase-2/ATP-dependent DNA helicase PcrA
VSESLSPEQQALVDAAGDTFVEACPGAGKTRAIVARFIRRGLEEPRKGIALLSFTNAAIDEARRRCLGRPRLLDPPHFVGTLDGFINRFITSPIYASHKKRLPSYVEEWGELYGGRVGPDLMQGQPLALDCFGFDDQGKATLVVDRVPDIYARRQKAEANRVELEKRARKTFADFVARGTFACSASRWYATRALENAVMGPTILELLGKRFAEVIVDEGQDCDERELAILRALRSTGIEVVMVADFDQAIYEFRDSTHQAVRQFASELAAGTRLSGNYRSTQPICQVATSLRYGQESDNAVGPNGNCTLSVLVMPYKNGSTIAERLVVEVEARQSSTQDVVVLAHKGDDARDAAGLKRLGEAGETKVAQIAEASIALRSTSASAREKEQARARIERVLMETRQGVQTNAGLARICERTGVSRTWLRTAAGRLAAALDPQSLGRSDYAAAVREFIGGLDWPGPTTCVELGPILKAPKADKWEAACGQDSPASLRAGTIHSYKGREAPTVAVVLPKKLRKDASGRTVLDHWEQGHDTEARRVIYVGASRAERLAILVVHQDHLEQLERILVRDKVTYEVSG